MSMSVDTVSRQACREKLRCVLMTAWRERWSEHTWSTAIKQTLPYGVSGDMYDLAALILELAGANVSSLSSPPPPTTAAAAAGAARGGGGGRTPGDLGVGSNASGGGGYCLSPLLLAYLRRAVSARIVSPASVLGTLARASAGVAPAPSAASGGAVWWGEATAALRVACHTLTALLTPSGDSTAAATAADCHQLQQAVCALTHWLCRVALTLSTTTAAAAARAAAKCSTSAGVDDGDDVVMRDDTSDGTAVGFNYDHDDDDDDDDDDGFVARAATVAQLSGATELLATSPFLLCVYYVARRVDGRRRRLGDDNHNGGDSDGEGAAGPAAAAVIDPERARVSADLTQASALLTSSAATAAAGSAAAADDDYGRQLHHLQQIVAKLQCVISYCPTQDSASVTVGHRHKQQQQQQEQLAQTALQSSSPASNSAPTGLASAQADAAAAAEAAIDELVSTLLVVDVMCRRAAPVDRLAARLLHASQLRTPPPDPPSTTAASAAAEVPLRLALVHCVLRTCFQCLSGTHATPLARYWLQFLLLRVPRLLTILCHTTTTNSTTSSSSSSTCDNSASENGGGGGDASDSVVFAALCRLIDGSSLLLDRVGSLYTTTTATSATTTSGSDGDFASQQQQQQQQQSDNSQSSPSQQQQQQDCFALLLTQLVKNNCISEQHCTEVKQYRSQQQQQHQQQQPMTAPSLATAAPSSGTTDSPASVLRAEPTVLSILSTMHVQRRQCEQQQQQQQLSATAGSSSSGSGSSSSSSAKFGTVLLHLLGPSQHLVMGAAASVGLIQPLSAHLIALNHLCSRPPPLPPSANQQSVPAAAAGGSGGGDAALATHMTTLKNQSLVFEISFLIVVTTVKNYGRQALPDTNGGGGAGTVTGGGGGGPESATASADTSTLSSSPATATAVSSSPSSHESSCGDSFLSRWIDAHCGEHGTSAPYVGTVLVALNNPPPPAPAADDPVRQQLQLLTQLLQPTPAASGLLQPQLHWQLLCEKAVPLFVGHLLVSWCGGSTASPTAAAAASGDGGGAASCSAGVSDDQVRSLIVALRSQYTCVAVCVFASALVLGAHLPERLARGARRLLQLLLAPPPASSSSVTAPSVEAPGAGGAAQSDHLLERLSLAQDIMRYLLQQNCATASYSPSDCGGGGWWRRGSGGAPAAIELFPRAAAAAPPPAPLLSHYVLRVADQWRHYGAEWLVAALWHHQLTEAGASVGAGRRCWGLDHAVALCSLAPGACAVALLHQLAALMASEGVLQSPPASAHMSPLPPTQHYHPSTYHQYLHHQQQQQQQQLLSDSRLQWLARFTVSCVLICVGEWDQQRSQSPAAGGVTTAGAGGSQHTHYRYLTLRHQLWQRRCQKQLAAETNTASTTTSAADNTTLNLDSAAATVPPPPAAAAAGDNGTVTLWPAAADDVAGDVQLPGPVTAALQLLWQQLAAAVQRHSAVSPATRLAVHYVHETLQQTGAGGGGVRHLLGGCSLATVCQLVATQPDSFSVQQLAQLVTAAELPTAGQAVQLLCQHRQLLADAGLLTAEGASVAE